MDDDINYDIDVLYMGDTFRDCDLNLDTQLELNRDSQKPALNYFCGQKFESHKSKDRLAEMQICVESEHG